MQKEIELIINKVSLKHNIPKDIIKAVFESQFYCARTEIKKAEIGNINSFPTVRFRHLGVLTPREFQIKKLTEKIKNLDS